MRRLERLKRLSTRRGRPEIVIKLRSMDEPEPGSQAAPSAPSCPQEPREAPEATQGTVPSFRKDRTVARCPRCDAQVLVEAGAVACGNCGRQGVR